MAPIVISIVVQWALILGLAVICLAMLAELGRLKSLVYGNARSASAPTVDGNGPEIGSDLPAVGKLARYHSRVARQSRSESKSRLLFLFLSVHCESCHDLVDGINHFAANHDMLDVLVIMRGSARDIESFQRVFALRCDIIPDETGTVALEIFGVRHIPFGILYGADGKLRKKGFLFAGEQSIEDLLREEGLLRERDQAVFSHGDVGSPV